MVIGKASRVPTPIVSPRCIHCLTAAALIFILITVLYIVTDLVVWYTSLRLVTVELVVTTSFKTWSCLWSLSLACPFPHCSLHDFSVSYLAPITTHRTGRPVSPSGPNAMAILTFISKIVVSARAYTGLILAFLRYRPLGTAFTGITWCLDICARNDCIPDQVIICLAFDRQFNSCNSCNIHQCSVDSPIPVYLYHKYSPPL